MDILQQIGIQRWRLRSGSAALTRPTQLSSPALDTQKSDGLNSTLPAKRPPESALNSALDSVQPDADTTSKVAETAADTSSVPPYTGPVTGPRVDDLGWQELADLLDSGTLCESCGKQQSVFGNGNPDAQWVFVVESPTARDVENRQLLSGRSGQLFEAILQSVGLTRDQVYLSSARKCPAVGSSNTTPLCSSVIHRQIDLIKPRVVLTLGELAARAVLRANDSLNTLRSSGELRTSGGIPVLVTFGADEMLDHPDLKAQVWRDLKKCLRLMPAVEH